MSYTLIDRRDSNESQDLTHNAIAVISTIKTHTHVQVVRKHSQTVQSQNQFSCRLILENFYYMCSSQSLFLSIKQLANTVAHINTSKLLVPKIKEPNLSSCNQVQVAAKCLCVARLFSMLCGTAALSQYCRQCSKRACVHVNDYAKINGVSRGSATT